MSTIDRQAAIDAIVNRTVIVDTDARWLSGHARCELEIIDIINALPSAQPERMYLVQQAVYTIMNTSKSDSIKDKCFRNAARLIQNAIDGEPQDFELIPDEPERNCEGCRFTFYAKSEEGEE